MAAIGAEESLGEGDEGAIVGETLSVALVLAGIGAETAAAEYPTFEAAGAEAAGVMGFGAGSGAIGT